MLCREYQEFFSDLYDGDLASERRADLESHLASCSPCQDEYKIFKESLAALQGMGEVPASDKFAARVRYAISQDKERGMLYAETGLAKPSTRRVMAPPPARRSWAFGLAGVAAVAAMALGVLYVSQRDEFTRQSSELSAKKREVEKLKEDLRNVPKPEVLDNVVIVNGKKISPKEFIEQKMAEQGLVATGTTWISKEIKEHLDKGEVNVDGAWTPMAQVVQQGIEDWRKKNPEVTKQGLTEDEVLASKGLVPHGKWFVPKEWAAALEQGQLITKSGESQDPREIIAAAMKENNLVDYEGRWMTDEQRTELVAQRRVQKSDLITTDSAVTRALDNLEIGAPLGYKNLTLYPLLSKKQKDVAFTTLPEAITTEKIELTDDINALQIHVKNKGASELVVLAGEILAGGNYGRVVARDTIIPAQTTAVVDVFDAEPTVTRKLTAPKFAKESGHYWAPLGVRRALVAEQGQGAVWSLLQTMMAGKVSTPKDLYAMHRSALFEYRAALYDFHEQAGIVGVAVAVGDNIVASELFANHAMFVNQFDRVLNSAAIEAILASQSIRMPSSLPSSAASVKRMLENVFSAEHEKSEGSIVLKRNGVPFGNAVLKGEDALRVTIFADGALEVRNAADVPNDKFEVMVRAFNDRLKASTPARRQALYREMAMLPARIAKPLGEHLKNSRKEAATFEAVAQTLSKLGGEDSAMALIRELDPDTLECAKIVAEYIPAAMRTLKERVPLEKAVTALISNMEHITSKAPAEDLQKTADANGFPFTVQTLRLAMRLDGQKVADYSAWWKDPVHRDEFYARMLK